MIKVLAHKSVTAPKGFLANGIAAGLKASGKKDLALLFCVKPALAVAAFTANKVVAAPVIVSKQSLSSRVQALIINSGNANALTGPAGLIKAKKMQTAVAKHLNIKENLVQIASTGVIGRPLEIEKIEKAMPKLVEELSEDKSADFAEAILTTDAFTKQIAVEVSLNCGVVKIGGAAKGAGMISPSLQPHATMIAVITTDALISAEELRAGFKQALNNSFNNITVDGDMSTNDCVYLLASGLAANTKMSPTDKKVFFDALIFVFQQLAKMIVRDGEGATKLITYKIVGAKSVNEALKVGKAVANSLLVKTAWFGEDPNWGRLFAAMGACGVPIDPQEVDIDIAEEAVVRGGQATNFHPHALKKKLKAAEFNVWISLGRGAAQATVFGCDLNYNYVKLNSQYTT